jgi:16S rRNA (cytosine967-C5)-methyltransferase
MEKHFKVFHLYIKYLNSLLDKLIPTKSDLNLKLVLKQFGNKNRQLGSRDRRFIQNVIYGFYRWYPVVANLKRIDLISLIILLEHLDTVEWRAFFSAHEKLLWDAQTIQALSEATQVTGQLAQLNAIYGTTFSEHDLLPSWLHTQIKDVAITDVVNHMQNRAPITIWINQGLAKNLLANELGQKAAEHPYLKNAFIFKAETPIKTIKAYQDGRIEIQDIASQMIVHTCNPKENETWWDACAGAGGKALHLAKLMNFKGKIIASDLRGYMLKETRERSKRLNSKIIETMQYDLTNSVPLNEEFDGVLIDAPCTGSGTWRRHPQLKWTINEASIIELTKLQLLLLERASEHVKAGGALIYSTCSIFHAENEEIVDEFLKRHIEFKLDSITHPLTGEKTEGYVKSSLKSQVEDGMFAARLIRIN